MRPGMRRDWAATLAAFDAGAYLNELSVEARCDRLDEVINDLAACGLEVVAWYGVRVFNDSVSSEALVPMDEDIELLLDAEDEAGRRDPYRWMASHFHVVAARPNEPHGQNVHSECQLRLVSERAQLGVATEGGATW